MPCAPALKATDVLRAEHVVIEQTLDVLEHLARGASSTGRIDLGAARDVIEVLRTFADACHHAKEEDILFPTLEKIQPGFGPAMVMRYEHEEGRRMTREMTSTLESNDPAAFSAAAWNYALMLRQHIQKEDHCLWPMVDAFLDDAAQQRVLEAFRRAETERVGRGVHEQMLAKVEALVRATGVTPRSRDEATNRALQGGCCGHHG